MLQIFVIRDIHWPWSERTHDNIAADSTKSMNASAESSLHTHAHTHTQTCILEIIIFIIMNLLNFLF